MYILDQSKLCVFIYLSMNILYLPFVCTFFSTCTQITFIYSWTIKYFYHLKPTFSWTLSSSFTLHLNTWFVYAFPLRLSPRKSQKSNIISLRTSPALYLLFYLIILSPLWIIYLWTFKYIFIPRFNWIFIAHSSGSRWGVVADGM